MMDGDDVKIKFGIDFSFFWNSNLSTVLNFKSFLSWPTQKCYFKKRNFFSYFNFSSSDFVKNLHQSSI